MEHKKQGERAIEGKKKLTLEKKSIPLSQSMRHIILKLVSVIDPVDSLGHGSGGFIRVNSGQSKKIYIYIKKHN